MDTKLGASTTLAGRVPTKNGSMKKAELVIVAGDRFNEVWLTFLRLIYVSQDIFLSSLLPETFF